MGFVFQHGRTRECIDLFSKVLKTNRLQIFQEGISILYQRKLRRIFFESRAGFTLNNVIGDLNWMNNTSLFSDSCEGNRDGLQS